MSLRKAAKANWHYDCQLCEYTSPRSVDKFGAEEAALAHERGAEHIGNLLAQAFAPVQLGIELVTQAFADVVNAAMDGLTGAFDQMAYALAPPQNVPHDPSLRADKRKWGGK